jgi:hypothetical protein
MLLDIPFLDVAEFVQKHTPQRKMARDPKA